MIRLQLDLPEGRVNYNEFGAMTSIPIAHVPNQIKNFGIPVEITGYVSDYEFFAYRLESAARKFSLSEQLTLLRNLGFLTIPYVQNEEAAGDSLITQRDRFAAYGAKWIHPATGEEFKVAKITTIKETVWNLQNHTLVLEVKTDDGVFTVSDMRYLEYFQVGGQAKLFNGELQPYRTMPVTKSIPTHCPKCNNPLKRVQIYNDLPLFYQCTSAFCDKLVLDEPAEKATEAEPEVEVMAESFPEIAEVIPEPVPELVIEETSEPEITTEETVETESDDISFISIINLEVDDEVVENLLASGKIILVSEDETADYILTKTDRSITKRSRTLSKESGIPLISVENLEAKIND